MTPLRVIMLSYERGFLDPASEASRRLEGLASDDVRISALILSGGNSSSRQSDHVSVQSFDGMVPIRIAKIIRGAFKEVKAARKRGEQVIVTAQDPFIAGKIAFIISRIADVPYEVQEHGDFFSGYWERERSLFHPWLARLGRFIIRRADAVRTVSGKSRSHIIRRTKADPERIIVNPVVSDLSWHLSRKPRHWPEVPVIVVPCRFVRQKGLDTLLRALERLEKDNVRFRLRLIGSGPLEAKIRSRIRELGWQDHVSIESWAPQESLWNDADLFVCSSRYEGWGRTIVEAMAARVPVVTTDVGCVGSLFRPQVDGRVIQPNDAAGLADAIKEQFEETDRREWMVGNAYDRVGSLKTSEESIRDQHDAWRKICIWHLAFGEDTKKVSGQTPNAECQKPSRRAWISTAILIVFASMVRLVSLLWFWKSLGTNVERGFFTLVQNWFLGNGFSFVDAVGCASAYRSPGYLFFLTGTYGLFGFGNFLAQAIIQNIIAVLIVYAVYRLGWAVSKDRRIGLVSGFLIALHPYTFYHYTQFYHTFLSSFFLVLLMLALLRLEETKRMAWAFWSGVMIALLAYVQGTILPATVFLSLWLLIRWRKEWKRAIGAIAVMALVSAALIAPWTIRNWTVFHSFVPLTTDLGHAFAKANNAHAYEMNALGYPQEAYGEVHDPSHPLMTEYVPLPEVEEDFRAHGMEVPDGFFFYREHPLEPGLRTTCEEQQAFDEVAFNAYWTGLAKDWLREHYWPDGLKLQAQKIVQFWNPALQPTKRYGAQWSFGTESIVAKMAQWSLIAWVLLAELFAIIGLVIAKKKKLLGRLTPFLIVLAVYTLMHSFFAGYTKYRIPLDNLVAIIAAVGLVAMWDWIASKRRRK